MSIETSMTHTSNSTNGTSNSVSNDSSVTTHTNNLSNHSMFTSNQSKQSPAKLTSNLIKQNVPQHDKNLKFVIRLFVFIFSFLLLLLTSDQF